MAPNSNSSWSSRHRLLAALKCQDKDHIPLCFMLFTGLRPECSDEFEFYEKQLAMGLDTRVEIPDLLISFEPEVTVRQWKETAPGERYPILHKEYATPDGTLSTAVYQTGDWLYGDDVPLFDDYLAARSKKFLVEGPEDLPALRWLFAEPTAEVIAEFREHAARTKRFASDHGLLVTGGGLGFRPADPAHIGHDPMCMGVDALMWLCGAEAPLIWAYEAPDFLEELIALIARWNRRRMEITLDEGVDFIIKRAWYEGTEFWSPKLYRQFVTPILQDDVRLAHEAEAAFGYILTSGMMPLFDDLIEVGIDAIIGIDPVQGKGTELGAVRDKAADRISIWGGVNGCITVETGTPEDVRDATETAIEMLGSCTGFVLGPVDNVRELTPETRENVRTLVDTWRANRSMAG